MFPIWMNLRHLPLNPDKWIGERTLLRLAGLSCLAIMFAACFTAPALISAHGFDARDWTHYGRALTCFVIVLRLLFLSFSIEDLQKAKGFK